MLSPLLQGLDLGQCICCNATAVRQQRCSITLVANKKIFLQFLYFHLNTASLCRTCFITINRYFNWNCKVLLIFALEIGYFKNSFCPYFQEKLFIMFKVNNSSAYNSWKMRYMLVLSRVELYFYIFKFYILWLHTGRVVSSMKFQLQSQKAYRELFYLKYSLPPSSQRSMLTISFAQGEADASVVLVSLV